MKFEFETIPLVQEKKKTVPFTIKPIGGPDEIKKWREMQAAKESVYRLRLNARNQRLMEFEQESGQKLDAPKVSTASWTDKLQFAAEERARLAKAEEQVTQHPPWELTPKPKLTVGQRIIGFFKSRWKNANF